MTSTRRLTGRIRVPLPPVEAFRLFTPRGEQDWAHGWDPRFPAPSPDDTQPGTVFETSAHGQHTIWLVTDRQPGKRISYARVTPGDQAGTVTVSLSAAGLFGGDASCFSARIWNRCVCSFSACAGYCSRACL